MKVSYFPGCTLKNKAKDLDEYARKCAEVLGVTLEEIPEWQCCGGVFTSSTDEIATKLSSVRALIDAKENNRPLVTICSGCHNVIKRTNEAMTHTDTQFYNAVNRYLGNETAYSGETEVLHYLELLRDKVGFEAVKEKVVKPLSKKVACYYGCLLLRPNKVMAMDDPENPTIMENLIKVLGGEPVSYSMRNECCGGYLALEDKKSVEEKSSAILNSAINHGAEVIVTACPLCKYNLEKSGVELPVIYITELLAEAFGIKE